MGVHCRIRNASADQGQVDGSVAELRSVFCHREKGTVQTCAGGVCLLRKYKRVLEVCAHFGIGACLPLMKAVVVAEVAVVRVRVQVTTAVEAAAGIESLQYQSRAANAYQQRQPTPISRGDLFF